MEQHDAETSWKKQISLYLDNELSAEEKDQLLEHLRTNPQGDQWLQNEMTFRQFIRQNVKRVPVTDHLKDEIRRKIQL